MIETLLFLEIVPSDFINSVLTRKRSKMPTFTSAFQSLPYQWMIIAVQRGGTLRWLMATLPVSTVLDGDKAAPGV